LARNAAKFEKYLDRAVFFRLSLWAAWTAAGEHLDVEATAPCCACVLCAVLRVPLNASGAPLARERHLALAVHLFSR
jgi:hypothetical protein